VVTIATGLSVGILPAATALSSLNSTPSPRRVAVATSCLAKALQVPELLPVDQLESQTKVKGLTVINTKIQFPSNPSGFLLPIYSLADYLFGTVTDNSLDVPILSR
jgi:hypothetical protein